MGLLKLEDSKVKDSGPYLYADEDAVPLLLAGFVQWGRGDVVVVLKVRVDIAKM